MIPSTNPNNKILHKIITKANKTVVQTTKVLGLSDKGMYNVIHNPFKLSLTQLHTLASFLDINHLELYYLLNANTHKLTEPAKWYLEDVSKLPPDFDEYSILKPEHLK
jgi:hypothetical protein